MSTFVAVRDHSDHRRVNAGKRLAQAGSHVAAVVPKPAHYHYSVGAPNQWKSVRQGAQAAVCRQLPGRSHPVLHRSNVSMAWLSITCGGFGGSTPPATSTSSPILVPLRLANSTLWTVLSSVTPPRAPRIALAHRRSRSTPQRRGAEGRPR